MSVRLISRVSHDYIPAITFDCYAGARLQKLGEKTKKETKVSSRYYDNSPDEYSNFPKSGTPGSPERIKFLIKFHNSKKAKEQMTEEIDIVRKNISLEDFISAWNDNGGDEDKVAEILNLTSTYVKSRYTSTNKKYKDNGLDSPLIPRKSKSRKQTREKLIQAAQKAKEKVNT